MARLPRVVAAPAVQPCAAADQGGDPRHAAPCRWWPRVLRVAAVVLVMAVPAAAGRVVMPAVLPCPLRLARWGGDLGSGATPVVARLPRVVAAPALLLTRVAIPGWGALPVVARLPGWWRCCW
ncbi:hypothetical protein [Halomonas alkalicola]|uniref:hypothetical protein n=1 Tax=Halomonas alkalicola TaxID=1930622 RepID=UPI00265E26E0|nr:hypothetical protein [Halomonas alkalicola]